MVIKHIPNGLSISRFLFSLLLLFFTPFSVPFIVFYALCVLTDMADGFLAKALHSENRIGAILDSAADLVFFLCAGLRLFPFLRDFFTIPVLVLILVIADMKLLAWLISALRFKKPLFLHTYLQKATGILLVLFPFLPQLLPPLCVLALLDAIEELILSCIMRIPDPDTKSLRLYLKKEGRL